MPVGPMEVPGDSHGSSRLPVTRDWILRSFERPAVFVAVHCRGRGTSGLGVVPTPKKLNGNKKKLSLLKGEIIYFHPWGWGRINKINGICVSISFSRQNKVFPMEDVEKAWNEGRIVKSEDMKESEEYIRLKDKVDKF